MIKLYLREFRLQSFVTEIWKYLETGVRLLLSLLRSGSCCKLLADTAVCLLEQPDTISSLGTCEELL